MEKVKVTKEQAEAIEEYKETVMGVFDFLHDLAGAHHINSHGQEQEEEAIRLMRAFTDGYEVEPEYSEGDWVVVNHHGDEWTAKISNDCDHGFFYVDESIYVDNKQYYHTSSLRHATPEEIKQEKERRWWAKHGRDVWELHESDLLLEPNGVISKVKYISVTGDVYLDRGMESIEFIKDLCKVVVFSESRLDVNSDE